MDTFQHKSNQRCHSLNVLPPTFNNYSRLQLKTHIGADSKTKYNLKNKQTDKSWTHAQHNDQSLGQLSISHSSLLLWKVLSLLGSDSPHLNNMSETFSSGFFLHNIILK